MVVAFAVGCNQSPPLVRIIESDVIDSLLVSAPQTIIDLDARAVQEWTPDLVLGEHPQDSLVVSGSSSFVFANDSLYILDMRANAIFVADLDGLLHRMVGRQGRGPVEFDNVRDFTYSGSHFFVAEASRVQVLSRNLEYVDTMPGASRLPGGNFGNFVSSPTQLYTLCYLMHAFRICPRNLAPPYAEGRPFLPAVEYTEGGPPMNLLSVGVTPDGQYVMAAFQGLPYLFVFDSSHRHVRTIRFTGDVVKDHSRNYAITMPGIPGTGLRPLVPALHVLNNEYVMVQIKELWYVFHMTDRGNMAHVSTVRLQNDNSKQVRNIESVTRPSEAQLLDAHLYVTSSRLPYVLRYPFPECANENWTVCWERL